MRVFASMRIFWCAALAAGAAACSSDAAGPDSGGVESIAVSPSNATVAVGASLTLSAEVRDAAGQLISGRRVTWSSEDETIAQVSSSGIVTGRKVGTVMIAASAVGKNAFSLVTVNPTPVSFIRLSLNNRAMRVGETFQLTAEALDAGGRVLTGRPITWVSSNVDVATVTNDGLITAISPGGAVITASSEGKSESASITVSLVPVASVNIEPAVSSLVVGQNTQLTAETRDASGNTITGRVVTWSTSASSVATVSSSGLVTANAPGSATITATSEGRSSTASVTVAPRPVSSVIVSPNQMTLTVGQASQLNISITDDRGQLLTGRPISFTSSDIQVVTVSSGGLVTGIAPGTATITAVSEGKTGTADVTVTPQPVGSVEVLPSQSSIIIGHSVQLTAIPRNAAGQTLTGRPVSWRSGAPGLASVSSNGLVTGLQPGTAVIIATIEGITGSATVTVAQVPVASVTVTPSSFSLTAGQKVNLSATLKDASGNTLTGRIVSWSSSDNSVATVASNGEVTGVGSGSATISAASEGQVGTAAITVGAVPVATVNVAPSTAAVDIGSTVQLTATTLDASGNTLMGRAVSWSSSDNAIAVVSPSGVVTGVSAGVVTITGTSEGMFGTSTVTVNAAAPPPPVPVASVTVAPNTVSLTVGGSQTVTATTRDANGNVLTGRAVSWSSSNTNVATVTSSGVITATGAGSATITATSEGQSGTASVTVTAPPPPPPAPVATVTVTPNTVSLTVGGSQTVTATTRDANGNVLTGRTITWSSANTNVATVTSGGVITATGSGTTTVTATSEGQSGSVTVNVAAPSVASVTISPSPASVNVNWTVTLVATPRDANGNAMTNAPVSWSSSNSSVAAVSSSGVVTGVSVGSAVITASSGTGSGTATVNVQLAPVNRVVVSPTNPTINENQTVQLTATLYDARNNVLTGRVVTWSSADNSKVSVSSSGLARGLKKGTVTVTATSEGISGFTDVKVR